MTTREVRFGAGQDGAVRAGLAEVRRELNIPAEFPADVLAEAEVAARKQWSDGYADATDVAFVTVDPPESMDLDQAVHIEPDGAGFRVRYAIADVAAFAPPGGPIDTEARRRGLTVYAPDGRVPLHPTVLSEGAASLLPDQVRPAVLWDLRLDDSGAVVDVEVGRALVRSRARLSYDGVQTALDTGTTDPLLLGLREVGLRRQEIERQRGGIDLPVPEQVVEQVDDGWSLTFRAPLPVEGWNAQISLLTGMTAAQLMIEGGTGILRTMPAPQPEDLARVRRTAAGLGLTWPEGGSYADLIRSADPDRPAHLAFLSLATTLLRGAAYTAFDQAPPQLATHSAVAASYAHVTAPLRRLVDRFGTEAALAAHHGRPVPGWVTEALPTLPDLMAQATRTARAVERESINLVEAVLLNPRVGEVFRAAVVDSDDRGGFTIVIKQPGVRAKSTGPLTVGVQAEVELAAADPERRTVLFVSAEPRVDPTG